MTDYDRLGQTRAHLGRLWQTMTDYGRLWQTMAVYGRLWQTRADQCRLRQTRADQELDQTMTDQGRLGQTRPDQGRLGQTWADQGRHGHLTRLGQTRVSDWTRADEDNGENNSLNKLRLQKGLELRPKVQNARNVFCVSCSGACTVKLFYGRNKFRNSVSISQSVTFTHVQYLWARLEAGNTNSRGRLSTVDLLFRIASFVKR